MSAALLDRLEGAAPLRRSRGGDREARGDTSCPFREAMDRVTGWEWAGAGSGQGLQARGVALGDLLGGTASGAEVGERKGIPVSLQEEGEDGVGDGTAESERGVGV
jgi:hypothetical protein